MAGCRSLCTRCTILEHCTSEIYCTLFNINWGDVQRNDFVNNVDMSS